MSALLLMFFVSCRDGFEARGQFLASTIRDVQFSSDLPLLFFRIESIPYTFKRV